MVLPKIAQVIGLGAGMLGKAFVEAYKESMKQAAANGARKGTLLRSAEMQKDEAMKILNVENPKNLEDIAKKYEYLVTQNSTEKGGSPYIQEKVRRAKEVLEMEMKAEQQKPPAS